MAGFFPWRRSKSKRKISFMWSIASGVVCVVLCLKEGLRAARMVCAPRKLRVLRLTELAELELFGNVPLVVGGGVRALVPARRHTCCRRRCSHTGWSSLD